MIETVNKKFVSTWALIGDLRKLAERGDELAKTLVAHWKFPLDIMFLTPDGRLITKLKHGLIPGVPHEKPRRTGTGIPLARERPSPVDAFLNCMAAHFGED